MKIPVAELVVEELGRTTLARRAVDRIRDRFGWAGIG